MRCSTQQLQFLPQLNAFFIFILNKHNINRRISAKDGYVLTIYLF